MNPVFYIVSAICATVVAWVHGYTRGFSNCDRVMRGVYHCWPKRDHQQLYNERGVPIFPPDQVREA
jgi:hypothetical protein